MDWIPIFGRINWNDYQNMFLKGCWFIWCQIMNLFSPLLAKLSILSSPREETPFDKLGTTQDFAQYWGYDFQNFIVNTSDGYYLGLHRITIPSDAETSSTPEDFNSYNSETNAFSPQQRPIVLLWHGFMMNSEVFVCKPELEANLAFILADLGYDVWLGNSRGNKYSLKHQNKTPDNQDFWDFSIDDIAREDLPATIDLILNISGASNLTYIGFSMGSTQGFAALSSNPALNYKINLFIGLASVVIPGKFNNRFINGLVALNPNLLYMLFGRRSILPITHFCQNIFSRKFFVSMLDLSMYIIFGWQLNNMSYATKSACYVHLYSTTSAKVLVHFGQFLYNNAFHYFDDAPVSVISPAVHAVDHIPLPYPTSTIQVPLVIFYGGSGKLSDHSSIKEHLPAPIFTKVIPQYEHLDFLWAEDAPELVFSDVIDILVQRTRKIASPWPKFQRLT